MKHGRTLAALFASSMGVQACATASAPVWTELDDSSLYELRVDPRRLSPQAFIDIADNAEPMLLEVPAGGTLTQSIERRCGVVPVRYLELARTQARVVNEETIGASIDAPAGTARLVEAPYCFPIGAQDYSVQQAPRANLISSTLRSIETFAPVTFRLRRATSEQQGETAPPPTVLDAGDPQQRLILMSVRMAATEVSAHLSTGSVYGQPLQTLSNSLLQQSDPECLLPAGRTAFRLDARAIQSLVADNADIRNRHADLSTRRVRSIVILDSGIAGLGTRPFSYDTVNRVSSAPRQANSSYPDYQHGGYVASTALGGPDLAYANPLATRIELMVANLIDVNELGPNGAPGVLRASDIVGALENLTAEDVAAVNLSVRFVENIQGLNSVLARVPSLVVVAAGNDGQQLQALAAYPARLGGTHQHATENVLTVAALDLDGRIAAFSNRGADFVEIAAPGCAVAVLQFDPQQRAFVDTFQSGTSFAAPLVSYAAALTSQESGLMGVRLKNRLLYAADLHPELSSDVAYGRVVNPVKAASVFTDVVEMSDGRLVMGRLEFTGQPDIIEFACEPGGAVRIARENLRKISAWREGNIPLRLVFYEDPAMGARVLRCAPDPINLILTPWSTNEQVSLDLISTRDVVFALTPYWQNASN